MIMFVTEKTCFYLFLSLVVSTAWVIMLLVERETLVGLNGFGDLTIEAEGTRCRSR